MIVAVDYSLLMWLKHLLAFISPQRWIILTWSESCCVGLKLFCQWGIWYVHGCSNPISAADLGPQDLLCLYQTCFMLCLSTVCLLWTRRKRSCLHVEKEREEKHAWGLFHNTYCLIWLWILKRHNKVILPKQILLEFIWVYFGLN